VVVLRLASTAWSHSIRNAEERGSGYRDDLGVAVLRLHRMRTNIPIELRASGCFLTSLGPLFRLGVLLIELRGTDERCA
jgi:hypothetical protein